MSPTRQSPRFACIRIDVARERAEWTAAEAFAAGASGLEEREEGARTLLLVYAPAASAEAVRDAALAAADPGAHATLEGVAERDWPETWKQGLAPIAISPRLVVRPSTRSEHDPDPGRVEVVIEPRQAFGTGAHGSTALALALVDAHLAGQRVASLLDVGAGSGVLAIAALRLGAGRALACDLDPIAARESRENAARNGCALASFAGSLDALGPRAGRFDLVVANLLSSELRPILDALVARVAEGGALVLSGLLESERGWLETALAARGLGVRAARCARDASGDAWLAVTAAR
jgi:ribosomal protein L11 methyltransferase